MARSIIGAFEETVQRRASAPAARFRDGQDRWGTRTWTELDRERKALAAGLLQLGLQPRERVNILASTSYRWMLADLAIQSCGGEVVAIYQSNLANECEYIINDSGGVLIFVENQEQLDKVLKEKDKLGRLRKAIVMDDEAKGGGDFVLKFSDVLAMGQEKLSESEGVLRERTAAITSDDVLTLIYTSGTTGMPKGVVLTHGNWLYEAEATRKIELLRADDCELLFLPMAHSFARLLQSCWLVMGHELAIDADLGRITENMATIRPTVMASVPRVFEKVYSKVIATGLESSGLKGQLFKRALAANDRYAQRMIDGQPVPLRLELELRVLRALVFSKIGAKLRATFGGRLRYFISGGAPLPKKMAYFFANAGITILEGYGLTETSAATTVNRFSKNKLGTVGAPMPGTELRIAEDGEVQIRGPGVMREYWGKPEATRESISPDGWFASGDIGILDQDGYLRITDRKKDIIVTAGGKNVAPQNIENLVKATSPLVSQVMVHGDKRNYLVALVTVDADNAKKLVSARGGTNGPVNGEASSPAGPARDYSALRGPSALALDGEYSVLAHAKEVEAEVAEVMKRVNAQLPSYETIKKFKILDKDFEIGQELTPTLKVKRKYCSDKYRQILDGFYAEKVE